MLMTCVHLQCITFMKRSCRYCLNFPIFLLNFSSILAHNPDHDVPPIVTELIDFLSKHALDIEGIFRKSANVGSIRRLQQRINKGNFGIAIYSILPFFYSFFQLVHCVAPKSTCFLWFGWSNNLLRRAYRLRKRSRISRQYLRRVYSCVSVAEDVSTIAWRASDNECALSTPRCVGRLAVDEFCLQWRGNFCWESAKLLATLP